MIELDMHQARRLEQPRALPASSSQPEGIREYLDVAAIAASGIIVLLMAISSVFALGQMMGHSILSYSFATIFVVMSLVLVAAFWFDYLPQPSRKLR